ncbi:MAG: hypothetical protein KF852_00635 [Saprospiraceae bacterium]|nr:hypothetical protein [Saprospiraceae bacterium]
MLSLLFNALPAVSFYAIKRFAAAGCTPLQRLLWILPAGMLCVSSLCAQGWETVHSITFPTNNWQSVPSVSNHLGFLLGGNGATGAPTDWCARSSLFAPGTYLAILQELSDAYEYRISWNVKSAAAGKVMQLRYHTTAGASGTDIGEPYPLPQISATSPGQEYVGEAFGGLSGMYHLILTPAAGSSSASALVFFDNFRLERRLLPDPPTSLSFVTTVLTVDEGASTQVCLHIEHPSPTVATTAEVAVEGAASPHFTGFQPQALTFLAGSSAQQCFTLSTAPANGLADANHTYTFRIQNVTGGNNAEAGAAAALTVMVADDTETPTDCPWAGPDREICRGDTITIGCVLPDSLSGLCFYWWPQENMEQPSSAQTIVWPDESIQYVVYVTDDQGQLHGIDTVTITVLQPGTLRISPNPSYLCNGAPDTLRTAGDFATYLWSSGQTSAEIVVSTPGMYQVTATSAEGCEVVDSVVVQVFDFQVQLAPQNPVFCQDSITFTATSNAHTMGWYVEGDLMTYSNEFVMHWIAPVEAVFYGPGGCREVRHIEFSRAIPDVVVFPVQPVICFDDTLTLSAAPGFVSYRWYDYEGGPLLSNTPNLQVTQPNIFYIEVTDANGCTFGKDVDINYAPAIDAQISAEVRSICYQLPGIAPPVNVNRAKDMQQCATAASLDAGEGFSMYLWNTGATLRTIQVVEPGEYSVTVTDASGCTFSPSPIQIDPCMDPPFRFTPGIAPVISCVTPAKISPGAGYAQYLWSDGSILDTLTTTLPGLYSVTVTDFSGCQATQQYRLDIADANAIVDLEIYKPAVLTGNTTTLVTDEDATGAMTFVNDDNDDGDKLFDMDDKDVANGDNELVRIRLKLNPAGMSTRTVTLNAAAGGHFVKIWRSDTKKAGEYNMGTPLELTQQDGNFYVLDLWVEGIAAHTRQRETILVLECAGPQASQCLLSDSVSLTIVGLKELAWKGRLNGFDGGANQSNTLDTADPNFPGNLRNRDNSPLLSYRVFPDMRIINGIAYPPVLTPH